MGEQDQPEFPRYYFSAHEPQGRVFQNQQELDEAGGSRQWFKTPTEAADAAAQTGPQDPPRQEQPPASHPIDEAPSSTARRRPGSS